MARTKQRVLDDRFAAQWAAAAARCARHAAGIRKAARMLSSQEVVAMHRVRAPSESEADSESEVFVRWVRHEL